MYSIYIIKATRKPKFAKQFATLEEAIENANLRYDTWKKCVTDYSGTPRGMSFQITDSTDDEKISNIEIGGIHNDATVLYQAGPF